MAIDDDTDDDRPGAGPPLPPDDRLWRHPSEVGGGTPLPAAYLPVPARRRPNRSIAVVALASACLTGAAVAIGVMWMTRPTRVVHEPRPVATARPVTTVAFAATAASQQLVKRIGPSLVPVSAEQDGSWVDGTGVWLDADGTIAVASTLVGGATTVMIAGADGDRLDATVVGTDAATGITVLKVEGETGTPLKAQGDAVEAGQPVAVIGASSTSSPGTGQPRVLAASISAVSMRAAVDPLVLHDALQLDRSVPADVLGGAVVDADGNLVGIVLSRSGTEDLAVVTPAGDALSAARSLRDDGTVRRAWLGVRAVDLSPAEAKLLDVSGGATLSEVTEGSPAAKAELAVGDVITELDGQEISGASDLVVALRSWTPGDEVAVTWRRGADEGQVTVTLGG